MKSVAIIPVIALTLCSCGLRPPALEEFWEREPWKEVKINDNLGLNIKKRVFCELVSAIRSTQDLKLEDKKTGRITPALPRNYGVQMQMTLTVEESGALNPSINVTDPSPSVVYSGVGLPQSIGLSANGVLSSVATRVDTSYAYYNIETISGRDEHGDFTVRDEHGKPVNSWCDALDTTGSSPILRSDLGLETWLRNAVFSATYLHSSSPKAAAKDSKLDIFSYQVKFVVVSSVGINPVIRIAKLTTGSGNQPLIGLGRTRTHDLTLTFGPGAGSPIAAAIATHFSGQVVPVSTAR
jgi:hypothetical protein